MEDLWMTTLGEPLIGPTGDFLVAYEGDAYRQSIMFRLKTVIGDFLLSPDCGASLESLLGKSNSPETGGLMESLISNALSHDGFFSSASFTVTSTAINLNTIVAIVEFEVDDEPLNLAVSIDLREGQVNLLGI